MIYLNPGDKVWYIYPQARIIVQATVIEVDDIYTDNKTGTVWHYRYQGQSEAMRPTEKADDLGWPIWEKMPEEELSKLQRVNQFIWIDEITGGHEISLGDECWLTLAEAMANVYPSKKRHLKRRLKMARRHNQDFVAKTWKHAGEQHPGWEKMPLKKIYVRRY